VGGIGDMHIALGKGHLLVRSVVCFHVRLHNVVFVSFCL